MAMCRKINHVWNTLIEEVRSQLESVIKTVRCQVWHGDDEYNFQPRVR